MEIESNHSSMVVSKRMMHNSPIRESHHHHHDSLERVEVPLHLQVVGDCTAGKPLQRSGSDSSTSSTKSMWSQKSCNSPYSSTSLTSSSSHSTISPQWTSPSSPYYDDDVEEDDVDDQEQQLTRHSSGSSSSTSCQSSPPPSGDSAQFAGLSSYSSSHQKSSTTPWFLILAFAIVAAFAMHTMRTTVIDASEQVSQLKENRDKMADQFSRTEQRLLKLKREVSAIDAMGSSDTASTQHDGSGSAHNSGRLLREVTDLKERLKSEKEQVTRLKEQVQSAGKLQVLEKYGSGARRVEVELVFPDRQIGPHRFVIELAPVEVMPHSVHTFLEMVTAGLLDGCSFILNALHVVKAAPLPYDGSSAADKAKAFTAHGLESVSFKEYSDSYPHKEYTVGFAADGSPSFYINTQDNSEIHAGDPCFGKIVQGIDAIQRLEAQPTRNGIWFQKRIGIKSARLLKG